MKGIFKRLGAIALAFIMLFSTFAAGTVTASEIDYRAEYQLIIERWEETIIGSGEMDLTDEVIADKVASITTTAKGYWDSMTRPEIENPTKEDYFNLWLSNTVVFSTSTTDGTGLSGHIWSDKSADPIQQGSSDSARAQTAAFTTNFNRIRAMALAYRVGDETLKDNAEFLKETMYALEFLTTYWYADTTVEYGNWWDWNVGIPLALNDTAVLLRNYVDIEFLKDCVDNINNFTPHTMLGANLNWRSCIKAIMGAFLEESSYLESAKTGFEKVLTYVTSSDGFYESDGSFKQHNYFAYIGSYGGNLYKVLSASLVAIANTPWDISYEKKAMALGTIKDSVEPLLVNGQIMELVYGRSVAASGSTGGYAGGRMIVNALPIFAEMAEGDQVGYLKSLAKEMLEHLTSDEALEVYDYYADTDLGVYLYAKDILEDETVLPFSRSDKARVFYNMDRIVQHNDKYSLGLAIHSTRTGSYEQANGNNTRGWYQASGMLFVYNDDYKKYSDHYWYTTDFWRMPGTTSLYGVEMTAETGSGSSCGQNPWAGGTELGDYAIGSMFMHPADMTLNAKKSYFMFDNEVVALGAGITSSDNAQVETTLENIKLLDDNSNKFIIDGVETTIDADSDGAIDTADNAVSGNRLQNAVSTTISKYAHISGNTEGSAIGYYFPESTTINIVREARTGNNYLVNPGSSIDDKTPYTKNYLKMFYSHGLNAEDTNSYSYVLLPGATAEETATYSDVDILSNTEDIQAVYDKKLNMTGATIWNDGESTIMRNGEEWITSNGACSLMVSESEDEITIAVSDPTQLKTDKFCIEINAQTNGVVSSNEDITVLQHGDKTIIEVNPQSIVGNKGETKTITLTKGEYVSEEDVIAPVLTGEIIGTKEGTAVSKYVTIEGTRPLTFTTDCTVEGIAVDRFGTITVADTLPVGKYTFNVTAQNEAGSSTAEFIVIVTSNITPNKTTGAVAYYTFNEGYGTTAEAITQIKTFDSDDFSGKISETVEWVDGFIGTGLKFDSLSDTMIYDSAKGTYPGSIGMNPTESAFGGGTEYDFWVKFDTDPTTRNSDQWIISKGSKEATTNIPWAIKVTKEGKIAFLWNKVAKTSSNWKYSDALQWKEGEWYHINITHNSDYTMTFKRDGITVGSGTTAAGYTNINRVTSINGGAYLTANTDQYFNGTIDELYLGKAGGGEEIRLRSKVSFDTSGGNYVAPQYVDMNGTATAPSNPTKDGYIFLGWVDSNGKMFDFSTEIVDETIIYAAWADCDSEYAPVITPSSSNKVVGYYSFDDGFNDGSHTYDVAVKSYKSVASKRNYNGDLSDSVQWVDGFVGSAVNFDSANDTFNTVAYGENNEDGVGMRPSKFSGGVVYDFWIKFNENPADREQFIIGREHAGFKASYPWGIKVTPDTQNQGKAKIAFVYNNSVWNESTGLEWNTDEWYHITIKHASDYTATIMRDGLVVNTPAVYSSGFTSVNRAIGINYCTYLSKSVYLNATIDELYLGIASGVNAAYVRHKVSFDTMGGDYLAPQYVWKNDTAIVATPTKSGYKFAGWFTDSEFATEFDFATAITSDITLYAKWEEDKTVAQVDGVEYETLQEAIDNADGKTVTLLKDIALTEKLYINNTIILDMAGYSITASAIDDDYNIIVNGGLTVTGNGTFNLSGTYGIGVWGTAVINGGTFSSAYCAINGVENGIVTVNGGVFDGESDILIAGNTVLKGGNYDRDVSQYVAYGYGITANEDGSFGVYNKNVVWGDANGDGVVDSLDMANLRHILIATESVDKTRFENYDANGDQVINTKDLVRLKKYFAELNVVLGPEN